MSVIYLIIVGAAAGFLATRLMKLETDIITTIAIGVAGALIGGLVLQVILTVAGLLGGLIGAVLGALLLIWPTGPISRAGNRSQRGRRAAGLIVLPRKPAQHAGELAQVFARKIAARHPFEKALAAHVAIGLAQASAIGRGAIEHFLAAFLGFDQPGLDQFAQRVIDGVGVLDIEQEADIRKPLVAVAVIGVVQDEDFQRAEIGMARCRHAARHPARKGVEGDDQAEFEFGQFPAFSIGKMA